MRAPGWYHDHSFPLVLGMFKGPSLDPGDIEEGTMHDAYDFFTPGISKRRRRRSKKIGTRREWHRNMPACLPACLLIRVCFLKHRNSEGSKRSISSHI